MSSYFSFCRGPKKEKTGIDNETLTGGIVHKEGYYLPRGMILPVVLRSPIDTRVSQNKDLVTVQTKEDIVIGDYTLIPANSFLHGYINELERPGKFQKRPKVNITFDTISSISKNSGQRRYLKLKGSIREKQILEKATRVNDKELYKKSGKRAGIRGGIAGASLGYAYTAMAMPLATFGIHNMLHGLLIMGSGGAGAYLAAGLVTKDDIRLEPGTELEVILEEPSIEPFAEESQLAENKIEKLSPQQAYDKYDELEAQLLENAGKAKAFDDKKVFSKIAQQKNP